MTSGYLTGKTILLVDDRPENLLSLEALLEGTGAFVQKASSGEEALRFLYLNKGKTDCILMDVQMPFMSGFEAAALLQQLSATAAIPVIFVTALEEGQAQVDPEFAPVLSQPVFVHKPLTADNLFRAFKKVMNQEA